MIDKTKPVLSVITVVYNAADRLKSTIGSVVAQDYDNIEYIIKDGGSSDGTVEVIEGAAAGHDLIRYVSSSDDGIYDAMNTALSMATGDVVQFLNAGDRFAATDVVRRAMKVMADTSADIVYGDIIYENMDGSTDVRAYPQSCSKKIYYLTGDCINHQCMFAKRQLFEGNDFDTSLKICADREWMLRIGAYTPKRRMSALGFPVAIYPLDGVSVINKERYKAEADICIRRHMPWGYPIYRVFEFARSHDALANALHRLYEKLYFKD